MVSECRHAGCHSCQRGSAQPGGRDIVYADDGQILRLGHLPGPHSRENRETGLVVVRADGRNRRFFRQPLRDGVPGCGRIKPDRQRGRSGQPVPDARSRRALQSRGAEREQPVGGEGEPQSAVAGLHQVLDLQFADTALEREERLPPCGWKTGVTISIPARLATASSAALSAWWLITAAGVIAFHRSVTGRADRG